MSKDVINLSMGAIDADPLVMAGNVAVTIALNFFPEIKENKCVRFLTTIDSIDDDTIENIKDELIRISKEFKALCAPINTHHLFTKMDNHICLAINRKVVRVPVCIEVASKKPKEPWDPQVEANAYQEMKFVLDNIGDLTDQYAHEYASMATDEIIEKIRNIDHEGLAIETRNFYRVTELIISNKITHIIKSLLREERDEQREKAVAVVIERNKKHVKYQVASIVKREIGGDLDTELKEIISELSETFPGLTAIPEYEWHNKSLMNLGWIQLLSNLEPFEKFSNVEKFYEKSGRKLMLIYKPIPR
jgi:hypothetical protein